MGDCGIADHENLGGRWLREVGVSAKVSTLVARHVDAKRYLCCVNPEYHAQLSEASKTTLGYQGGPMTPDEAAAFERDELFKIIIAMRRWDEAAKVPNKQVPTLDAYRYILEENIIQSQAESSDEKTA
jgi:predicted HD phosphohydrolase